jgi:uncharacterized membrane protein HdeD (DUF308 family)
MSCPLAAGHCPTGKPALSARGFVACGMAAFDNARVAQQYTPQLKEAAMQDWMKWIVLGVVSIVFGVLALGNAVAASVAVTLVTGLLLTVAGSVQTYVAFGETGGHRLWSLVLGIVTLLLGLSFMVNPLGGTVSLAILVTVFLVLGGVVRLVLSWAMRATRFFWPMLLSGALTVLLAGYILANFAAVSLSLMGILLGVELLFNGAGLIVLALFVKSQGSGDAR